MKDQDKGYTALQAIDKKLSPFMTAHSKGFDAAAFCKMYESVKPFIPAALKLIEAIPVYGPKIGRLLRLLCKIADALCASS